MLAAVQQDGRVLWLASKEMKGDREVVLAAVQQNGRALEVATMRLRATAKSCWPRSRRMERRWNTHRTSCGVTARSLAAVQQNGSTELQIHEAAG